MSFQARTSKTREEAHSAVWGNGTAGSGDSHQSDSWDEPEWKKPGGKSEPESGSDWWKDTSEEDKGEENWDDDDDDGPPPSDPNWKFEDMHVGTQFEHPKYAMGLDTESIRTSDAGNIGQGFHGVKAVARAYERAGGEDLKGFKSHVFEVTQPE